MGGETERAQAIVNSAHKVTAKEDTQGNVTVNYYQDVEPHMEYAAKCRRIDAEERGAFGKRGEFRRTMAIPINVIYDTAIKLGIPLGKMFEPEHSKRIYKAVKGHELKAFRTVSDRKI